MTAVTGLHNDKLLYLLHHRVYVDYVVAKTFNREYGGGVLCL